MKFYVIPAYGETARNKKYKQLITEAERRKYEVIVLNLQIKGKLLSSLTKQGIEKIGTDTNCVIFGFSIGALIAYNISTIIPVKKIILASTSPALGPDIKNLWKKMIKDFSKKTVEELKKLHYKKSLAKEIVFLYGDKERGHEDYLIERTKKLYKTYRGKKELVVVKDTNHELASDYIKEIIKRI